MNLFKKLFNWNRKERDEKLEELSKKLDVVIKEVEKERYPIYRNRMKVGENTIVVFQNGDSLSLVDKDNQFYNYCQHATSEQDVRLVFQSLLNKEEDKKVDVISEKDFLILKNNPDFIINGNKVYLNGINIPIPQDILAEFIVNREEYLAKSSSFNMSDRDKLEDIEDMYNRLIFFWAKLANSPVADRDNVMTFLRDNDVRISKYGNIIAYRNVVKHNTVSDIDALCDFVNKEYNKVKLWKKAPKNYSIGFNQKEYKLFKNEEVIPAEYVNLGILSDLKLNCYDKKEEKQLYTSWHNQGKYVFTVPSLYRIDKDEVDPNTGNCSSGGLHFSSVTGDYSSFGDVSVVVLVNPAQTIHIPNYATWKARTSEMYIACINPNEHGDHIDESLIEEADKIYNDMTVKQLKEAFANKSMETLSIDDMHVPETSLKDVSNIISILSQRVVNI